MNNKIFRQICALGFTLSISFYSFYLNASPLSNNYTQNEVDLKTSKSKKLTLGKIPENKKQVIKNFEKSFGDWNFTYNLNNNSPRFAYGPPANIESFSKINSENAKDAALKFIELNCEIFDISLSNLKFQRVSKLNNLYFVTFLQTFESKEVLFSKIELKIRDDAKVVSFKCNNYSNIILDKTINYTNEEIKKIAKSNMKNQEKLSATIEDDEIFILPQEEEDQISFSYVKKINVNDYQDQSIRYIAYVDLASGKVIWRYNQTHQAQENLQIQGTVKLKNYFESSSPVNFSNLELSIDNTNYLSDSLGKIKAEISNGSKFKTSMLGTNCEVKLKKNKKTDSAFVTIAKPSFVDLDNSSSIESRHLYYHTNFVINYLKSIDTSLKVLDRKFYVSTDGTNNSPNAYSNADSIVYVGTLNPDFHLVLCSNVLYHEFGHSLNTLLYKFLMNDNKKGGMLNSTAQEGTADINAAFMQDSPYIGIGSKSNSTDYLRNLKNTLKYPQDMQGEGHADGQILGGAMWDFREITNDLNLSRRLAHFSKYGLPDDPNVGVCFYEWLFETISADDNLYGDNDLSNGTPHLKSILKAFNLHNIGTSLILHNSFVHENYADNSQNTNYSLDVNIQANAFGTKILDKMNLIWSVDDFKTKNMIQVNISTNDNINFEIPNQKVGSIIKYYFESTNLITDEAINFYLDDMSKTPFLFVTGYNSNYIDDFEKNTNWKISSKSSNSTNYWSRTIPKGKSLYGTNEPTKNVSKNGVYCYGLGLGSNVVYTTKGISTDLQSPLIDLNEGKIPILKFYSWLSVGKLIQNTSDPILGKIIVYQSEDQLNWQAIDTVYGNNSNWVKNIVKLENAKSLQKFYIKFEYIIEASAEYPIIVTAIDDFEILTLDKTNDIENDENNVDIEVFPNPTNENLTIKTKNNNTAYNELEIVDINGKQIFKNNLTSDFNLNNFNWNLRSNLGESVSAGTYFLNLKSKDKITSTKFIIK